MARLLMAAKLYAIRHVDTGWYMPQMRTNRGYSFVELENFGSTPRLFWSLVGANKALSSWRKGPRRKSKTYQDTYTGEWDFDPGGDPVGKPPESRMSANMEIVEFDLAEIAA